MNFGADDQFMRSYGVIAKCKVDDHYYGKPCLLPNMQQLHEWQVEVNDLDRMLIHEALWHGMWVWFWPIREETSAEWTPAFDYMVKHVREFVGPHMDEKTVIAFAGDWMKYIENCKAMTGTRLLIRQSYAAPTPTELENMLRAIPQSKPFGSPYYG
jgi:hypothetical protein